VVFSNEVRSTFTAMSSRNLLSDHVSVPKVEGVVRNRIKLRNEKLGRMSSSNVLGLQEANEVNGT